MNAALKRCATQERVVDGLILSLLLLSLLLLSPYGWGGFGFYPRLAPGFPFSHPTGLGRFRDSTYGR